jgi:hypothetical protein
MKDNMLKEKNMEKESSFLQMAHNMKENLTITIFMEMACIFGQIRENMKVNGKETKCTVKVSQPGLMAAAIMESK